MRVEGKAEERCQAEQEHVAPIAANTLLAFPREGVRQSIEPGPLGGRRLRAGLRLAIAAEQTRDVLCDLRLALLRTGLGLAVESGGERRDRPKLGPGARGAGLLDGQVQRLFAAPEAPAGAARRPSPWFPREPP